MAVSARFTLYHHRIVPPTYLSIPTEYEAGWTPEQVVSIGFSYLKQQVLVECVWNVMAHAQKQDFSFWRNRQVHLNRRGRQFSQLLAAELCASAIVMLDTPCSEVVWRVLATHSIRQFSLHYPPPPALLRRRMPSHFIWIQPYWTWSGWSCSWLLT
jgi:hypothetical protein